MSIKDIQRQIVTEFQSFDDWMDKYNYLIDLGKNLPLIEGNRKVESNLITGCQSRVWLNAEYKDGKIYFSADSDAVITRGIVSLLIRIFSGSTPVEIINAPVEFIDEIGLKEHLSPTRSNGLNSMIKQMKLYAVAFKAKYENGNE